MTGTLIPREESGSILYSRFPTFFGINVDTGIDKKPSRHNLNHKVDY